MARGKKALASPFVPPDEQPYSIPKNWRWVKLEFVCSGQITDGTHKTPKYCEKKEGVPFVSAKDVTSEYIDWLNVKYIVPDLHQELYKRLAPQKNDILLAKNGTTGVAALVETNDVFDLYVTIAVLRPNIGIILPRFLYRLINSPICKKQFNSHLTGIGVPNLHLRDIKNISIPLPPLSEQRRIVDHIESLFAKLDEAKEKVQAVVDGFELRKSAILHRAFTGELTERWRKEHGKSDSDWRFVRFNEAAEIMSNLVDPADYQGYPHIAPDNIEKRTGKLLEYHTIAEDGVKSGKHLFHTGQILYSKIRPYLSKVIIVDFDGLCSADMYPVDAKEDARYLWYYMLSDEFLEQASNAGSRSVLPKINQKELSKVMVRMTSLEEQQAIVIILDNIFAKERHAKEAAEAVLSQIDTMKQSILARAFRGELGTNDPAEESSVELIKTVL